MGCKRVFIVYQHLLLKCQNTLNFYAMCKPDETLPSMFHVCTYELQKSAYCLTHLWLKCQYPCMFSTCMQCAKHIKYDVTCVYPWVVKHVYCLAPIWLKCQYAFNCIQCLKQVKYDVTFCYCWTKFGLEMPEFFQVVYNLLNIMLLVCIHRTVQRNIIVYCICNLVLYVNCDNGILNQIQLKLPLTVVWHRVFVKFGHGYFWNLDMWHGQFWNLDTGHRPPSSTPI